MIFESSSIALMETRGVLELVAHRRLRELQPSSRYSEIIYV